MRVIYLLFLAAADGTATVTPTVELNTLAMKRGEPAVYKNLENRNPHPVSYHNYDFRGMYNQRYVIDLPFEPLDLIQLLKNP